MRSFTIVVGTAVLVSGGLLLLMIRGVGRNGEPMGGLPPGNHMPVLNAVGWLNGKAPSSDSVAGKVVVVNAWATWCVNCRQEMPKLVDTYEKFRGRGVLFIGLTNEGAEGLAVIEAYLKDSGVTWLNGYGATQTLLELEAFAIPVVWVIDSQGMIVWNYDSSGSLEDAIETTLAKG